jgi:hypothetical protein
VSLRRRAKTVASVEGIDRTVVGNPVCVVPAPVLALRHSAKWMLLVRRPLNVPVSIALPERRKALAALKGGGKQSLKRVLARRRGIVQFASNVQSNVAMSSADAMPKKPPNVSEALRPRGRSSSAIPSVWEMTSGLAPPSANV